MLAVLAALLTHVPLCAHFVAQLFGLSSTTNDPMGDLDPLPLTPYDQLKVRPGRGGGRAGWRSGPEIVHVRASVGGAAGLGASGVLQLGRWGATHGMHVASLASAPQLSARRHLVSETRARIPNRAHVFAPHPVV